jgi:cytochrome P450
MTTDAILSADLAHLNLADPETFVHADMDAVWDLLRREAPVYLHPETAAGRPFWVLTRYRDVLAVLKDGEGFSSAQGNSLDSLHKPMGDPAGGKILALTDNPRHLALRAMLLKAFTPKIHQLASDRIPERTDRLISRWIGAGRFDFAREVAEQIPMSTIGDLLGFPPEEHERLLDLSREALSSDESGQTAEDAWLARNELLVRCTDLMEARRTEPREDLVSAMVNCEVNGEVLTDDEVIVNIYGFILAGDHTSRLAMCAAVREFARRPEQWRALKERKVAPAGAVEEIARWSSPVMHAGRTAKIDVPIGDRLIRAGELVTAWTISANRDETVFPHAATFDVARTPNKHLSFGYGPHFCFGAYLGRAEITAVLDTLCRTVDSIELAGDPQVLYSTFLRGYCSLPVTLTAASGRSQQ